MESNYCGCGRLRLDASPVTMAGTETEGGLLFVAAQRWAFGAPDGAGKVGSEASWFTGRGPAGADVLLVSDDRATTRW